MTFLLSSQEFTEDLSNESAFRDDNFLSKNGQPKELFLSSDANAVVEHTKKVLVIEDGEVVHLKVPTATLHLSSTSTVGGLLFCPGIFRHSIRKFD